MEGTNRMKSEFSNFASVLRQRRQHLRQCVGPSDILPVSVDEVKFTFPFRQIIFLPYNLQEDFYNVLEQMTALVSKWYH